MLVLAIGGTTLAASQPATADVKAPAAQPKVRVMSYNIGTWSGGLDAIEKVIRASKADIVSLQEVHYDPNAGKKNKISVLAAHLGMDVHYRSSDQAGVGKLMAGNAILSKFKITERGFFPLSGNPPKRTKKAMVGAKLNLTDSRGNPVRIYTTHLTNANDAASLKARRVQTTDAMNHIKKVGGPVLFTGDLNAKPTTEIPRLVESNGFVDGWRATHAKEVFTAPNPDPRYRLDYVFSRSTAKPVGASVPGDQLAKTASDHRPMIVDIKLS